MATGEGHAAAGVAAVLGCRAWIKPWGFKYVSRMRLGVEKWCVGNKTESRRIKALQ